MLRRQTAWFLRHGNFRGGLSSLIEQYRAGLDRLSDAIEGIFDEWLIGRLEDATAQLTAEQVPEDLARQLVRLNALTYGPDIISLSLKLSRPELDVARIYFQTPAAISASTRSAPPASSSPRRIITTASPSTPRSTRWPRPCARWSRRSTPLRATAIPISAPGSAAQHASPPPARAESLDEILNGSELTLAKLTVAVAHFRELAEH